VRRVAIFFGALGIVGLTLAPIALILKQAFTPEAESFRWPPTWLPATPTLENFRTAADTVELARGLWMSLLVASLTTISTLAVCLSAAWAAARRAPLDRSLDAALVVTRLFPSIAVAVPLAVVFVRLRLYNHPAGLGLWAAHTLLAVPFAFFLLRNGFRSVPVELEEAACLDGATRFGAFWRITLPLIRPSLGAAALLVFLVSWDEFAYALLLQVTNRPLPPLLYYLITFGHPGLASAVATIMLAPSLLIIVILEPALRTGGLTGSGR
jgi:ABC-type glycerol-3-phosphate transport system permease component